MGSTSALGKWDKHERYSTKASCMECIKFKTTSQTHGHPKIVNKITMFTFIKLLKLLIEESRMHCINQLQKVMHLDDQNGTVSVANCFKQTCNQKQWHYIQL